MSPQAPVPKMEIKSLPSLSRESLFHVVRVIGGVVGAADGIEMHGEVRQSRRAVLPLAASGESKSMVT